MTGLVDYLCNAFTPDRLPIWEAAVAGLTLRIRDDEFVEPETMVTRMDAHGYATLLLPAADLGDDDFTPVAARWDEVAKLVERWPGRFAALACIDATRGIDAVRELDRRLDDVRVAGCYIHTHSFDLPFDAAAYYPFYAAAAAHDVPVVMQAGISGGMMPSECGRPIHIDRAALYFRDTRFVLSHTGYPWVEEAIAMARKFPNVFIGTGSYPPKRWPRALVDFHASGKVVFGTNFPTVGHEQAARQLGELGYDTDLLTEAAANVFTRLEQR
jgi:predicted TIM-barrel fold metal-dependent hydrolase